MHHILKTILCAVLVFLSAHSSAYAASMLEDAQKRGVLRVGFSTFVPWAMQDKHGKFIGLEIDIATQLAKDLHLKVEYMPTKWSGIIPALLTGQLDIIIAGMAVTPERAEKVAFSIPYDYTGMDIAASTTKAAGMHTMEDFNSENVILVARTGGTAKAAIATHFPKAQVRFFDEEAQAVHEVVSGKAHAFISSAPLPFLQARNNPDRLFQPLKEPFTKEPIGFALRKGDQQSLDIVNAWIEEHQKNGWLQERKAYWFKGTDWEKDVR